jgi:hypothetical protein
MSLHIQQKLRSLRTWLRQKLVTEVEPETRSSADPIDVVYTWVDGNDPDFRRELRQYAKAEFSQDAFIAGERRFRDNDELRYSLRSLETNASWVDRVFLVTNGQVPRWLKRDHPRLRLVSHRELFPNPAHLPTFNSAAIETHLHRIPGLSRRYLYLNDDMFFGNKMKPADFISPSGMLKIRIDPWPLPRSRTEGDLVSRWLAYNRHLLQEAFGERKLPSVTHAPILYDREVLAEMEARWPDEFERTSAEKFRTEEMVLVHVLYTHFLAAQGKCELIPWPERHRSFVMFQPPLRETLKALKRLRRKRPPFFCINDDWDSDDETKNGILVQFLETYFPTPSSFEREETGGEIETGR